jgi:Kef-type K+ transport system membrane component KefB
MKVLGRIITTASNDLEVTEGFGDLLSCIFTLYVGMGLDPAYLFRNPTTSHLLAQPIPTRGCLAKCFVARRFEQALRDNARPRL